MGGKGEVAPSHAQCYTWCNCYQFAASRTAQPQWALRYKTWQNHMDEMAKMCFEITIAAKQVEESTFEIYLPQVG